MNIILNEVHECTSEYDLTLYCMSHILVNCDRLKVKTSNFSPQLSFHGQMLLWLWPFSKQQKLAVDLILAVESARNAIKTFLE